MEGECDCPGPPPPQFSLPPPPRPPFLQEDEDCSEEPLLPYEVCDALPVLDAELHSSPTIPSMAVIVVSSVLLLVMLLIASVLLCKYKRKIPNLVPNKPTPQLRCDAQDGSDVVYEDVSNIRPRLPSNHSAPSVPMFDLKSGGSFTNGFPVLQDHSVYLGSHPYISEDLYNPVYEEISHGSGERGESDRDSEMPASEDEFAEDELSLGETAAPTIATASLEERAFYDPNVMGGLSNAIPDLAYSRCTVAHLPSPPLPPAPSHHPRHRHGGHRSNDSEFHEGMLLDALLHFYQPGTALGSYRPPATTTATMTTTPQDARRHHKRKAPYSCGGVGLS